MTHSFVFCILHNDEFCLLLRKNNRYIYIYTLCFLAVIISGNNINMSCLTHDKRFRSLFHNIINELRNENRMPVSILRTMPKACCTCDNENKETIESVIMKEENQFMKLKNLIERVNREKQANPNLILSLNRFENLIEQNRAAALIMPEPIPVQESEKSSSSSGGNSSSSDDSSSTSSDEEDITPMEISKPPVRFTKKVPKTKTPKSIKTGTFLFLPYGSEAKKNPRKNSDSLLDVAKKLQCSRFIGRKGHIPLLEKQYDVRINMITQKTSEQVTKALENAMKGLNQLTIHNTKKSIELSEKQAGEWVLIRPKKPQNPTNEANIEQVLDDLTNRWESCLNISKRNNDEEEKNSSHLAKRSRILRGMSRCSSDNSCE